MITLNDIWRTATTPSTTTLGSIVKKPDEPKKIVLENIKKIEANVRVLTQEETSKDLTEKDVINKITDAQAYPKKDPLGKTVMHYGVAGEAIIHPPAYLNLPTLLMFLSHYDKHSTYGEQDFLILFLEIETPKGIVFMPSAFVYDNPKATSFWKKLWAGTPYNQPLKLVRKNELQIQLHGNTFFAGWTVPIPLSSDGFVLPPACISLEGYGKVKPDTDSMEYPSGYKNVHIYNGMEAFVTFMLPSSRYSGPGTDGILARESIVSLHPPISKK